MVVIIGAIAELERNLIVERVRAGMRRAKLEGRHLGRKPLELDRIGILRDHHQGQSLGQLATTYRASRATQAAEKLALNFSLAVLFSRWGVCMCWRGSCGDAVDRVAFVDVIRLDCSL